MFVVSGFDYIVRGACDGNWRRCELDLRFFSPKGLNFKLVL